MTPKALAAVLVAALLLSGCASKGGGKDADSSKTSTASSTKTGSGSGTSSGTKSTSSSATGSSSPGTINVTLTRSAPNGAIPLSINFSLNATFRTGGKQVPAPSGTTWSVTIVSGNGTNGTANGTAGPTGTALPANFTLNFTTAGNHTVRAVVKAPGYTDGNATVIVVATAAGAGAPLFFDGAETDASQWTIASKVLVTNLPTLVVPSPEGQELAADHPGGKWAQTTDEHLTGAKSWHVAYPDNMRAKMTSVAIPAGGASHTLTYAYKGGAEGTSVEGLFVLAGPAGGTLQVLAHHSGAAVGWTTESLLLPTVDGDLQIQFRFDSDISCSSDPQTVPPTDPAGACGEGYDAGGYWLDDITVV